MMDNLHLLSIPFMLKLLGLRWICINLKEFQANSKKAKSDETVLQNQTTVS